MGPEVCRRPAAVPKTRLFGLLADSTLHPILHITYLKNHTELSDSKRKYCKTDIKGKNCH